MWAEWIAAGAAVSTVLGAVGAAWSDIKSRLTALEVRVQAVAEDVAQHAGGPAQLAAIRTELSDHDRRVTGLERRVERERVHIGPWRPR